MGFLIPAIMKLKSYRATSGKDVNLLPFDWYNRDPRATLTLKMEDLKKFRVEVAKGLKIVDKRNSDANHGFAPKLAFGSNDDWDRFVQFREVSDQRGAYKGTFFLNQHNPCWSDESFQFKPGSVNKVQV